MREPWRGAEMPAVHAVATLVATAWCIWTGARIPGSSLRHLPVVGYLALVFGQASVLGFWTVFSSLPAAIRLAGLVSGVVALEVLVPFAIREDEFRLIISITAGVIAVVMWVVKKQRADLVWLPPEARETGTESLQFSIARLMLGTAVVAVAVSLARNARQTFGHLGPSLFVSAVLSLGLVALAVAASWAALGTHRPGRRSLAVLSCASALGALFAYGIGEDDGTSLTYFTLLTTGQSAVMLATLLSVRLSGYRLVGRSRLRADPAGVLADAIPGPMGENTNNFNSQSP